MKDEDGNDISEYAKHFNFGYLLAKHIPEIAKEVSNVESHSMNFNTMKKGIEQFDKEVHKTNYPTWLKSDRIATLGRDDFDKSVDKDDVTREDMDRE